MGVIFGKQNDIINDLNHNVDLECNDINNIHNVDCDSQEFVRIIMMKLTQNNVKMHKFIDDNYGKFNCETYCVDKLTRNSQHLINVNHLCYGKICLKITLDDVTVLNFVVEIRQHCVHSNDNTICYTGINNDSSFLIKEETYDVPKQKLCDINISDMHNKCTFIHPYLFEIENTHSGSIVVDFYTNIKYISNVINNKCNLREILWFIINKNNCDVLRDIINNSNSSLCKYLSNYEFLNSADIILDQINKINYEDHSKININSYALDVV
jgi:hypothetical protein